MATRAIDKPSALGDIINFPNAAGIGYYGGILWVNGEGGPVPVGGVSPSQVFVVNSALNTENPSGGIYATVQAAVDAAELIDEGIPVEVVLTPGEYNEDVVVTRSNIVLRGAGPFGSCRITGTAAGTATALTLFKPVADGQMNSVGVYNVNLEGRSGGSALRVAGQVRRLEVAGCKLHGGSQAVLLDSLSGGQIADIWIRGNTIANSAIGVSMAYSGGDPCHQIRLLGNSFEKITTDCVVEDGATHDWVIAGNIFTAADGVEPTRFLDIDETGTTGLVTGNKFHTDVFAAATMAIATNVFFVDNRVEVENPGTDAYATNGRPD